MDTTTTTTSPPVIPAKPNQPNQTFSFPKRSFGQSKPVQRSFKSAWFDSWNWLHYDESRDLAFCHVCGMAVRDNQLSVSNANKTFVLTGFSGWKNATVCFKKHDKSICHKEAMERYSPHYRGSLQNIEHTVVVASSANGAAAASVGCVSSDNALAGRNTTPESGAGLRKKAPDDQIEPPLAKNDDTSWDQYYEELKKFKNRHGHCNVPYKYTQNPELGIWVFQQRAEYRLFQTKKPCQISENQRKALDEIGFLSNVNNATKEDDNSNNNNNNNDEMWIQRYEELKRFKAEHGHCNVPQTFAANRRLAKFVKAQRMQYRLRMAGKPSILTEERKRALDDVGMKFQPKTETWNDRYTDLKQFSARYGHCKVPLRYSENPKLGKWVNKQRIQYKYFKEGKPSQMFEERIKMLDDVGFSWNIDKSKLHDDVWYERFRELREFKALQGHCNVPQSFPENPKLGSWVCNQRMQYRYMKDGKPSQMNEDRIKELDEVGFLVKPGREAWEERYEELKRFRAQYGHCNVPLKFPENPKLGSWVSNQKTQYRCLKEGKSSQMTTDRMKALDEIGFSATPKKETWNKYYEELRQFRIQRGHCKVSLKFPENPKFGRWVANQRTQFRYLLEGKPSLMTEDRMNALKEVGFSELNQPTWNDHYRELKQFKDKHGHCNVPPGNPKIGKWVVDQRLQYKYMKEGKQSILTAERMRALDEIGFSVRMDPETDPETFVECIQAGAATTGTGACH